MLQKVKSMNPITWLTFGQAPVIHSSTVEYCSLICDRIAMLARGVEPRPRHDEIEGKDAMGLDGIEKIDAIHAAY
jgi:hypothetical protein